MAYFLITLLFLTTIFLIWKIPIWNLRINKQELPLDQYLNLLNENRRTIAQILGGLYVLVGLGFTWNQITATRDSIILAEKRFIRESYSDAIQQIGSEKPHVRLGGIYSLGNLIGESKNYSKAVTEVLSTYIRQNHNNKEKTFLQEEIQGAIDVISKNEWISPEESSEIILSQVSLIGFNFDGSVLAGSSITYTNFSRALFRGANFDGAKAYESSFINSNLHHASLMNVDFAGANLTEAKLNEANLSGAIFKLAILKEVDLSKADLSGTDFSEADLRGAIFDGAIFDKTNLCGADLRSVKGLTKKQIARAITNSRTKLPN